MQNFKDEALSENVRCLANHKLKARILKNNMMRDTIDHKEDNLGAKIIKYETFLSQNMLQNIKTEELTQFQQQVRQLCKNKKSMPPLKSQSFQRSLNMQSLFDQVRRQVKIKEKSKRRSKTYENSQTNFMLLAKPTQLINRENTNSQHINTNQFVREQLGKSKQFRRKKKQINLKGKIMNSSLVGIMQKMEDMKYFSNKTGRKPRELIELQSPFQLKVQKQRLNTAVEENQRVKFVPIGKISENSKIYHSEDKLFVSHMPKIVNKNVSENRQMKKIVNSQKKITQQRKSTMKLVDPLGLKFRSKRKSAQFKIHQDENDEVNDIKCF